MSHKRDKQAKAQAVPQAKGARLGVNNPEDANRQTPVWSLAIFDDAGPWGRELCEKDNHQWEEIYPKLRHYESMSWNQILSNPKRDHSVKVEGIRKEAKDRLKELRLDDIDELFRFRLSGKMRVWGIKEGRVFSLLWWDPEHEIWPVDRQ